MAFLVVFVFLLFTEQGFSHDDPDNSHIGTSCGRTPVISQENFIKIRNSTLNDLRLQFMSEGVFYARAQAVSEGDSVYAVAQCRNYLSVEHCVACFDDSVSDLVNCNSGNGGYVCYDNCFVRYEDFVAFYNDPYVTVEGAGAPFSVCGNQTTSQPTIFTEAVDGLLSNIRDATPKTSDHYVASTRQILSENATVYSIAQCIGNVSSTICRRCMDTAYNQLKACLPNTQGRVYDIGCFARYSDTPFFSDNQTIDITNFLKGNSNKVATIAAAIGGSVLLVLILVLYLWYRLRKKPEKTEEGDFEGAIHYSYKDLQLATNNFSEEYILGRGGFGEVYKAILDDNNVVAVKKLHVQNSRVKEEFENEIKLISNIHHRNLLRLLGWSTEGSYLLLVLECMPNGSLDRFLWGAKRGTLDWNQRYEIIFGIARGLAHLHNEYHIKIVHRDIKSNNILLSDDFKPKIADFGLARFQPEDQTHVSTKFAGTLGYTAPEYAVHGILSDKVDTYSFGIVVLEIISGRRSTEVNLESSSTDYLLEHAWKLYENKIHIKVVDETLNLTQYEQEHVMKIIEIALLCTQSPASNRPTMSDVVLMLQEGQSIGQRQLTRPTFVNRQDRTIQIDTSKNITRARPQKPFKGNS